MLDLSKSYGRYEGVTFFGDHQDDRIVYYLPDEIKLAPKSDREDEYEFSLQLFHDDKMEDASRDDLENTAGSLLQLSVNCMVAPERLENAFAELKKNVTALPSDALLTTPLWTDGSVDLITLDESSFDDEENSDMVKAIISTQRPSFTQDLKSIFNVRYDKRGTGLIYSAIKDGQGTVVVMYDMQFAAIQPAVDLKITAFLSRCQETARKNIDVNLKLPIESVKLDLGAQLEWLTRMMVENGDIKIEVTSQETSDEKQKQVDKLVDEFKETVLRELFKPSLLNDNSPSLPEFLSNILDVVNPVKIGFSYQLKKETISEDRIISVDYSERSAVIRHHNPKALLLDGCTTISDHIDDYVKKVIIGDLWRTQSVDIKLFYDFKAQNSDLESVEIIVWKHQDGVVENVSENCFAMPAKTKPLGDFIFSACEEQKEHNVSWLCNDDDDGGYYYQFRFIYSSSVDNHCSPKEIVTQALLSYSRTVSVVPDSYMFFKSVPVMIGSVDFTVFEKVEVIFEVEDTRGEQLANKHFLLDEQCNECRYAIRGKDRDDLYLWVTKVYYFKDRNKPPLKFPRHLLKNYAVMIDDPLIDKEIHLIVLGDQEAVEKLVFTFTVTSPVVSRPVSSTKIVKVTDEEPISIMIYTPEDTISYEITKVYKDADGKRKTRKLVAEEAVATELSSLYIDLDT